MVRMIFKDALQTWRQVLFVLGMCVLYAWINPFHGFTSLAFVVMLGSYVLTLQFAFEEERGGTLAFLASLPVTRRWMVGVKFATSGLFALAAATVVSLTYAALHGTGSLFASSALALGVVAAGGLGGLVLGGGTLLLFFGWGYRVAVNSMWGLAAVALVLRLANRVPQVATTAATIARWLTHQPMATVGLLTAAAGTLIVFCEYTVAARLLSRRDLL